jgi:adenylosuccinate synthase
MSKGKITIVMGAQYGSEGKGVIVSHLADKYDYHIRVGGPNAGHTMMHLGKKWKMQIVPCGWKNKNATLVIGRGGLIDPGLIKKEVNEIMEVDPSIVDRLKIDELTGVLSSRHRHIEGGVTGEFHFKIGSTGEGVGAARVARVNRDPNYFKQVKDIMHQVGGDGWELSKMVIKNTPEMLNYVYDGGKQIMVEGTQGHGLSLIHGPWPYCTSHDCSATQMAADIGFSPRIIDEIIAVCRTYPIRVWGNSGPMHKEIDFDVISERMGRKIEEKTTVTKKLRRIGEWDEKLFLEAVAVNRPTRIAVMFLDYLSPEDEAVQSYDALSDKSKEFIAHVEDLAGVPVDFACTGWSDEKKNWCVIDRH